MIELPTPAGSEPQPRRMRHGAMAARERITALFDPGTFVEWGADVAPAAPIVGPAVDAPGDGVITGTGTIDGKPAYAFAQDFAVLEGTLGERGAGKLVALLDRAADAGAPVVALLHSNGARVSEGLGALEGATQVFQRMVVYRGRVPMIAVAMGFCAGFSAYLATLSDLVIMVERTSFLVTTSPAVVRVATNQRVRLPELGGARMHAEVSGVAHLLAASEPDAIALAREMAGFLRAQRKPSRSPTEPMPALPANPQVGYDVKPLIGAIADGGAVRELRPLWAKNVVTALIRLDGQPVGVVANQPLVDAGALTPTSARKMAEFVKLCDAHGLPLVFLVDVPGILPGVEYEQAGILAEGAEFYRAIVTEVPRLALVTRKCYGGAYALLHSKTGGGALVLAYPDARIGVVGASVALQLLGAELDEAGRSALAERWAEHGDSVQAAAARGIVDRVIAPNDTRRELIMALKQFPVHAPGSRLRRSGWQA